MKFEQQDFEKILQTGISLTTQRDAQALLEEILSRGMELTNCDAATLYLYKDDYLVFHIMKTISKGIDKSAIRGELEDMPPVELKESNVCAYAAIHRKVVNIADVYDSDAFDFSGPRKYDALTGYRTMSQLVVPLENNQGELLGVLQMINALDEQKQPISFAKDYEIVIRSLGSMAAITLTNLSFVEALKQQQSSFVEAFTKAIDARTPYNGSHTRKVAEYAILLAKKIQQKYELGLCEQGFQKEELEKLRLAALLHDIGKMVVPLAVMNRPTRLGPSLEEIQKRFALLDAYFEIDFYKGYLMEEEYFSRKKELEEGLALLDQINQVGYLNDDLLEQAIELGKKVYVRSNGEEIAYILPKEQQYMQIRKGTLTEEDRKVMENHVAMTQQILQEVSFGKGYEMVPVWAGDHHELLDGTGYPRQLKGDEIPLETRILTIADIYDALTATDRPYKQPMPQERAISILCSMADEGKIELRLVQWLQEALAEEEM